jgi:hypothetical protein
MPEKTQTKESKSSSPEPAQPTSADNADAKAAAAKITLDQDDTGIWVKEDGRKVDGPWIANESGQAIAKQRAQKRLIAAQAEAQRRREWAEELRSREQAATAAAEAATEE